jgi:hypothetical protein
MFKVFSFFQNDLAMNGVKGSFTSCSSMFGY